MGEQDERRVSLWIRRHHVQGLHPDGIGQCCGDLIGLAAVGIDRRQLPQGATERAGDRVGSGRIAREIDRRRHVGVNGERRGDPLLGREQTGQVAVDLTDQTVRARRRDAVAARRGRLGADEMIALLDGEDEERVALVDAGAGQPRKELAEGLIIALQLLDVVCLARTPRRVDLARDRVTRISYVSEAANS